MSGHRSLQRGLGKRPTAYVLGDPARSLLKETWGILGLQTGLSLDGGQKKGHTRSHCVQQPAGQGTVCGVHMTAESKDPTSGVSEQSTALR